MAASVSSSELKATIRARVGSVLSVAVGRVPGGVPGGCFLVVIRALIFPGQCFGSKLDFFAMAQL